MKKSTWVAMSPESAPFAFAKFTSARERDGHVHWAMPYPHEALSTSSAG